jgi:hypothetical protein
MRMLSLQSLASCSLLAMVGLVGCGAGHEELADSGEYTAADEGDEDAVAADGVVLGTSWQELSYPYCWSPWSDPDGDGWGWENYRSCIVRGSRADTPQNTRSTSGSTGGTSSGTSSTCQNAEGTASTMAAVAVSAAMELRRWQPTKDFAIGRASDGAEILVLSGTGRARCSDGICKNTQALLDFQKREAHQQVEFPGNVKLDSFALRSRMVAKFRDQIACEMQPSNGGTTNCPVEEHTLTFQRSERGGCDTNYYFVAKKPDGQSLTYPAQLKNKLLWADRTNPYIGFQSVGEVVSIDPTYGLNEAGSTTSGSCSAACVKFSTSDLSNQCCSCNGTNKTYDRALFSSLVYLCK